MKRKLIIFTLFILTSCTTSPANLPVTASIQPPQIKPTTTTISPTRAPLPSPNTSQPGIPQATLSVASVPSLPSSTPDRLAVFQREGINLSGGEFGTSFPGQLGKDYIYPDCSNITKWAKLGISIIRYQVRLERLLNQGKISQDMQYVQSALDCAASLKVDVIIDIHNYGRINLNGADRLLTADELGADWSVLAAALKAEPAVAGYDIMNEPHDMGGSWPDMAQVAIDSIRKVDQVTPIIIEGDCWSGAHNWDDCNSNLYSLTDPSQKLVFSAHQYFDQDSSGGYSCNSAADCGAQPGMATERLQPFVGWCSEHHLTCFIGEMGIPTADNGWKIVATEALNTLQAACIGVALWSAGPWWGSYALSLELPSADWLIQLIR